MYDYGNVIENVAQCYLSHSYYFYEPEKFQVCYLNLNDYKIYELEDVQAIHNVHKSKLMKLLSQSEEYVRLDCFPDMYVALIWRYLKQSENEKYAEHFIRLPYRDDRFTLEFRRIFDHVDGYRSFLEFEEREIYSIVRKWCKKNGYI